MRARDRPAIDRFHESYVMHDNGCWLWMKSKDGHGYGQFLAGGKRHAAHRWAYIHLIGPIPDGLDIDHLCRMPSCVNPAHMEPVSCKVNSLRGESPRIVAHRTDTCLRGHPFTPENTRHNSDGTRCCRTCANEGMRRRQKERYHGDPEYRRALIDYQLARYHRKRKEKD